MMVSKAMEPQISVRMVGARYGKTLFSVVAGQFVSSFHSAAPVGLAAWLGPWRVRLASARNADRHSLGKPTSMGMRCMSHFIPRQGKLCFHAPATLDRYGSTRR
jgi:hypothetical protein